MVALWYTLRNAMLSKVCTENGRHLADKGDAESPQDRVDVFLGSCGGEQGLYACQDRGVKRQCRADQKECAAKAHGGKHCRAKLTQKEHQHHAKKRNAG